MGFPCTWVVFFVILQVMAHLSSSTAADYEVGDADGWTAAGIIDYAYWAYVKRFQVADQLVFRYDQKFHNVMEVNSQDFESCNAKSPILTYTSGQDFVKLTSNGHHYYICGVPGHCSDAGQKVHIFVGDRINGTLGPPPKHSSAAHLVAYISFEWLCASTLGMLLILVGYAY